MTFSGARPWYRDANGTRERTCCAISLYLPPLPQYALSPGVSSLANLAQFIPDFGCVGWDWVFDMLYEHPNTSSRMKMKKRILLRVNLSFMVLLPFFRFFTP